MAAVVLYDCGQQYLHSHHNPKILSLNNPRFFLRRWVLHARTGHIQNCKYIFMWLLWECVNLLKYMIRYQDIQVLVENKGQISHLFVIEEQIQKHCSCFNSATQLAANRLFSFFLHSRCHLDTYSTLGTHLKHQGTYQVCITSGWWGQRTETDHF